MKKLLLFLALCAFGFCAELKVAAAANVTYAFDDLKAEFAKTHPKDTLDVSLGSSGKLVAQVKNGAPFEVFMAANVGFAQTLYDDGFAVTKPVVYARGSVAMMSVRGFDLSKGLEILKDPKVKTIIIANPKTAPYGTATVETFKKAGIYDAIKNKLLQQTQSETLLVKQ